MSEVYQSPIGGKTLYHDCDIKNSGKSKWDCCDLKQFCAKVDKVNKQRKQKDAKGRGKLTRDKKRREARNREEGEGRFRENWKEKYEGKTKTSKHDQSKFYHQCAYEKAKKGKFKMKGMQVDHVHELQLGGKAIHQGNFKWLSAGPNASMGAILKQYTPKNYPGGLIVSCCPAEEQEPKCRNSDTAKLV